MKIQILDIEGKKIREVTTKLFSEPIREDLIFKIIEAEKTKQPYKPKLYAGMNRSASGKVRHKRHSWKSDRGRGMSRIPKKTMWRRGTQFSWIGAIVPNTRGGRRAHPPKGIYKKKKINKKEYKKALLSALTYIVSKEEIIKKYFSLRNKKIDIKLPIIVENKILSLKTKEFISSIKKILGEIYNVAIQEKTQRAGKGKFRGRRKKRNAGALLIISNDEKIKISRLDVVKVGQLTVTDLASNGARLCIFTEKAIKELEKKLIGEKEND
ncbi:MAG: 50S ribosomal protein L4 [Candidatus Pacearchaeota archaeon]